MSLKKVLGLVVSWRITLFLLSLLAVLIISPKTPSTTGDTNPLTIAFASLGNFDGQHYLSIAEHGYDFEHKSILDFLFFPLYPWTIRVVSFLFSYFVSGLLVSHLSLVLALYYLFQLVSLDFSRKIAKSTVFLMIIFPTAFFFGTIYTESLFLLLIVSSLYYVRKREYLLACLLATAATATKLTGILLWPAIIYEFWIGSGRKVSQFLSPHAIWLSLPPLGLLGFLRYQYVHTGDWFFFINAQADFASRSINKLVLLHQILFRYFRMVIFIDHTDPLFYTVLLELLCAVLVLIVLILSFKKLRFSYWIFSFLSFLLPTITGTFVSLPRQTLVLFPIFIFLATWLEKQHPFIRYIYYLWCLSFLAIGIMFFTQGYFVA